jgi:hypothetical protein
MTTIKPKTTDLRSIVAHTGIFSNVSNGSDGTDDIDLQIQSSKSVDVTANDNIRLQTPTSQFQLSGSAIELETNSNVARIRVSDSNELVFELMTSGSYVQVARFVTTV